MLSELVIENLALFERAELALGPGLNVVTGETGAGKSLLIDALELLLGERPRASLVRKGAHEARVEGRFTLSPAVVAAPLVHSFFAEHLPTIVEEWNGIAGDDERELILCRALGESGKARAWVNHRPVTQRLLKDLAGLLVEIHGQNEHQRLLDTIEQTRLLDAFGGCDPVLDRYRAARARWLGAAGEYVAFETAARERRERADLLRFQARELSAAKVTAGEHTELAAERDRLRYANDLAREIGGTLAEVAGEEGGAIDVVRRAERALEHWRGKVPELGPHADELREALAHLDEAAQGLEHFLARVEASPARLEQVENRLYEIETLEKKYRTDAAGLAERARSIQAELSALDTEDAELGRLAAARTSAHADVVACAADLTKKRRACVAKLEKAVHASLAELGLEQAQFKVRLELRPKVEPASQNADLNKAATFAEERRLGPDGADAIEFLLAANPGEGLAALRQVASGGETARIMLALRTALAVRQTIPTLVFDEVDSGVGGRLGPKVGEHLRALSERHQVLCVTHLPAIAALAESHFKVSKRVTGGRTLTSVALLDRAARVDEVADMIAGGASHATARAEAARLLADR